MEPSAAGESFLKAKLMKNYQKSVRPVTNASDPVDVRIGLTLINIFDMDEKNGIFKLNVWMEQEWKDELLTWNPKDFDGIKSLRIPSSMVWLPDMTLFNSAELSNMGFSEINRLFVHYNGEVFWPPPAQLHSSCQIDVTYFPFDAQKCYLRFGSFSYPEYEVSVRNRSDKIDLSNYIPSGEFDIIENKIFRINRSEIQFFFHIKRKPIYYFKTIIIPCMILSGLSLLTFSLPPNSGEKMGFGMAVLLSFSVFVSAIEEKLPKTSDSVPLIGMYLTVLMGMTSLSVVMTVVVLNLHSLGGYPCTVKPPSTIRWLILDCLRPTLRIPPLEATKKKHHKQKAAVTLIEEPEDGEEWLKMAQVVDGALFWIFSIATSIITFIFFGVMPYKAANT